MAHADEERCITCGSGDPRKPGQFVGETCADPYHLSAWDDDPPAGTEGYIVAGPDAAGAEFQGRLVADWDGEVHLSREAGDRALAECRRSGYGDWHLYALVPVTR